MNEPVPRPVTIVVALHALAALVFGALAHIDPANQFPELVANDDGLFAVGLYANRNIGIAVALAVALVVASRHAIAGLMLARFVTDAGDLVMALTQRPDGGQLIGQLVFFAVLFASEVYVIRTLIRTPIGPRSPADEPGVAA